MKHTPTESAIHSESAQARLLARQPLSIFGKLALGAFLVGTLLSGSIALVLTIANGAPSRDIVIMTACMLMAAILVATRLRWTPIVSALLGGFLLYFVITEPFVSESFANPKGPNGGLGHFIGDVIIAACTLIAFGASIAAAVQNYRQHGQRTQRWLPAALSLVVGMVLGAIIIGAMALPPAAASASTAFTNGVPTVHLSAGNFAQSSVTIPIGTKLLLVDDTSSLHVLANGSWQSGTAKAGREPGAPVVSDVHVSGNSAEIGPFATAGTFHIYCIVHPGMNLTIIVE